MYNLVSRINFRFHIRLLSSVGYAVEVQHNEISLVFQ